MLALISLPFFFDRLKKKKEQPSLAAGSEELLHTAQAKTIKNKDNNEERKRIVKQRVAVDTERTWKKRRTQLRNEAMITRRKMVTR